MPERITPIQAQTTRAITFTNTTVDSSDLEPATRTITSLSELSGLANADYSHTGTIAAISSSELSWLRYAVRLSLTIDSISAGATLRVRVYIDVQDASHRVFDLSYATSGTKTEVFDITSASLPAVKSSLDAGTQHTIYVFMWKDVAGAGNTVISACQLQRSPGTSQTSSTDIATLVHTGIFSIAWLAGTYGSSSSTIRVRDNFAGVNFGNNTANAPSVGVGAIVTTGAVLNAQAGATGDVARAGQGIIVLHE